MPLNELALRYELLNSQMNPHFINNAIQSICNAINQENVEKSIGWLNKLSSMYRLVQKSTKSNMIDLQDELEISRLYIELQRELLGNDLQYTFQIDNEIQEDIEFLKVPPLIFQPLIENAILHGLKNSKRKERGKITVSITKEKQLLCVCVTDNGNGISKTAKSASVGSGISLENIGERLAIINGETTNIKLLEVTNVTDHSGKILGAKSCLRIPMNDI